MTNSYHLQSSTEAIERVGAVPERGTVNSPGFDPGLLVSDPASTAYSRILSNFVWASVYSSANCGWYHLFCWANVWTRYNILKVERGRHVMGKCDCSPVPCWIGSSSSDPGQYPAQSVLFAECFECCGESCLHQVLRMVWIAKRDFRKPLKCFCENKT